MKIDIVRAWKDATYRASLSVEEQAQLPVNPAGAIELNDAELEAIHGAHGEGKRESTTNVNNVRVDTSGVLCLHSVQVTVDVPIIPVISPITQNVVCY